MLNISISTNNYGTERGYERRACELTSSTAPLCATTAHLDDSILRNGSVWIDSDVRRRKKSLESSGHATYAYASGVTRS
jgi:hypothetical protein